MKICDFVKCELDYILQEANFTKDEQMLFIYRSKDIPLEECAELMDISCSTVNRINRKMKGKVNKIEVYKGRLAERVQVNRDRTSL